MKKVVRHIITKVLLVFFCLSLIPLTPFIPEAQAAGVLPRALPDAGIYDRSQTISLSSEAGASIVYRVYGRATIPDTPYTVPIILEEDAVLSVDSTEGGVTTHKDFSYTINAKILSTYPAGGALNVSVNPTIAVEFSREMNESVVENTNNISIRKSGDAVDLPVNTADYTAGDNTLRVTLTAPLQPNTSYTVTLNNIIDSNNKPLQGPNSFSFTTVAGGVFDTYGTVETDQVYYDNVDPVDTVNISGTFIRNGLEVTANPLATPLQIQVVDPDQIIDSTINVFNITNGRFSTTYSITTGAKEGVWTLRLYDDNTPRQFLDSCTFTVGTVAAPTVDPPGGTYYDNIVVTLTTTTPGATIYYTTDNYIPDGSVGPSCTLYQGALTISSDTTLRAVAVKGGVKSALVTANYIVDTTLGVLTFSPTQASHIPSDPLSVHQTGISVNTTISVTFGRAVQVGTLTGNFRLIELDENHNDIPGGYVAGNVTYSALDRKATFTPANPLKPFTHYRVILGTGIMDLNGVHLGPTVAERWYFQTGGGQGITVDGISVTGGQISVNKNPVTVVVSDTDVSMVTINGKQAASIGGDQYSCDITLKAGKNAITVVVTDMQSNKRTTLFTINYLNLMQVGARVEAGIPAKGKLDLFDKQISLEFPQGTYLKDAGGLPIEEQTLVFTVFQSAMPEGFPSVSYMYDIQPKIAGAEINNKGEATLVLTYDKYVSASAASTLTVLCDTDSDGTFEENIGGKVDTKKRTVTIPFSSFGRYVIVNKVWTFSDYSTTGWARTYVEYLWAKGIMKPLATASPGAFGLTDSVGNEITITRGEFAAMMGKALGMNKSNYINYGIFTDMRLTGSTAYAKDSYGNWLAIDDDEYKYIDLLARNGILHGSLDNYNNLVFNYFSPITREEVAIILARSMNLAVETDDAKVEASISKMYTDAGTSISEWAWPYVLAASKGYLAGFPDKTFKGQDSFTRPQAARVIYQTMQKAKLL